MAKPPGISISYKQLQLELRNTILEVLSQLCQHPGCLGHLVHGSCLLLCGSRYILCFFGGILADCLGTIQFGNNLLRTAGTVSDSGDGLADIVVQIADELLNSLELNTGTAYALSTGNDFIIAAMHGLYSQSSIVLHLSDKGSNVAGSLAGLLSQLADFLCDDGEAAACLTGTGSLDSCIERQEVGLVCNGRYQRSGRSAEHGYRGFLPAEHWC